MSKSVQPALKFHERRRKQRELKEQQKRQGKQYPPAFTLPNRKSDLKTVDEEKEAIQQTTEATLNVSRQLLPGLLRKLSQIPDPRNPRSISDPARFLKNFMHQL